jgi:hypothetical protein
MTEEDQQTRVPQADLLGSGPSGPLVFISHDARDAELAEAFSKLIKSVSAGMIKTFRSSDKKGTEGIDFGEEWYTRLMKQLQVTSDVVCLFTERSLDRPWLLFEAGVAKGKLDTPVLGVALGVPLNKVSSGPFYQFMNMDDSAEDLAKLLSQLARRVPNLELDDDVVKGQIAVFKESEEKLLKKLSSKSAKAEIKPEPDDSSVAKLAEEMKALPSRVAERMAESRDSFRGRRPKPFRPGLLYELTSVIGYSGDPILLLMIVSPVREEFPWIYELAMEVYRAAKSKNSELIERESKRLLAFTELFRSGAYRELLLRDPELEMLVMDLPWAVERILRQLEGQISSVPSIDNQPVYKEVERLRSLRRRQARLEQETDALHSSGRKEEQIK